MGGVKGYTFKKKTPGSRYTPGTRGGFVFTPGEGTVTRGAVLSGARAREGGYSTVYGTLVGTPMGEATYWATRGMSHAMRGATIGAIEKSYRSPETLSAHERELIEPHLSKMPKEFQRKYHQAGIKIKLKKLKDDIRPKRRDVARKVPTKVADVPGITTSLMYGVTPETAKQIQLGLSKAPIVLAGERVGIEAEKLKRWATGEVSASQKAITAMEPSYTKAGELYTGRIVTHEAKWEPYIKDDAFIGKPYKYREYLKEFGDIKREGAQLETQYETFGQLEVSAEREEKERFWGLEEPYERKVKKPTSEWVKARIPETKQILDVAETPEMKEEITKTYGTYRRLFGMPSEPFEIEKKMEHVSSQYKIGMYESFREDPVKMVATTAVFAALPPVLKGAKHVAKAARFAPAAKWVQPRSLVFEKGIPKIIRKDAVKVGVEKGLMPSFARHIPKVAGYGMGAAYAGVSGHEMYVTPPSERAYKLGRMTTTEIAPMIAGTYIGVKAPAIISGAARAARIALLRKKIKMKELTPKQIIAAKKEIVYIEKGVTPSEFKKSAYDLQYEYGIPSEDITRGVRTWKAMPYDLGKQTVIRRSHFEMPGGYVSPEAQPFFFRIGRQKTKFELFGSDFPTSEIGARPTLMRMSVEDVARLPKAVRATRDPYSMTAYALGKGEVGKAYVSIPVELGTKMESEFVVAPTTGMKRTPSPTGKEYYTTWKRRVIPIEHYEWFETGMKRPQIGVESGKYYVKRPRATAIIETEKGIVLHPGERGEGLILPGGGIETAAEVATKKGVKVMGEQAAEAAMREVHEELGVSVSGISKRLFKYKSTEIPIYSRGRQKWYSKSYHDVFAVDIIGKPKPVSREVSKVVYWKPKSKMKLSKDTEAILKEYMIAKKRRQVIKEPVTKERMKRVVSKAKLQKERIKKGEVKTFEESLKYDEYDMYSQTQRRAALISPMGLGIEYGIKEVTRGPSYVPMQYKEAIAKDVAYPKYAQKEYVSKPYVSKKPTKYTTHVSYQEQKPTKYTKLIKHKKRVPYGKSKLTKYPEVVPYPEPTPTPYPKPTPTPTPKIIPYPEPEPTPKPKLIKYPEPFIVPSVLIEPKRKKQPRAKKKSYAWKVKNPIPELQDMFATEVQKRGPKLL